MKKPRIQNSPAKSILNSEQIRLVLESIIQQMPAGIIITDATGAVAKNNQEMDNIWRRKMLPSENIDDHKYVAFHADGKQYKSDEWPLTRSLVNGEIVVGEEMRILRGDGSEGTFLVSSSPIRDDKGDIIAGVVIDTDITERKRIEKELRESLEANKAILNASSQTIFLMDTEGVILALNKITADRLGRDPSELLGRNIYDFLPPKVAASRKRLHQKVIRTGKMVRLEDHREGRWFDSTVYPFFDDNGQVSRFVVFSTDITERKRAEDELAESRERFTHAVNAAREGVWDWNMETNEVWYSPRYKEMLGYSGEQIEHNVSAWLRLLHPDDKERSLKLVDAVMRGERDYEVEFRLRHKDGHYLDILSRGFPIRRKSDGKIVRIVGTHFDLTDRKRTEEALQKAKNELEIMVQERTSELHASSLYARSLIEANIDPLVTISAEGKIMDVNRASEEATGYSREQLIGSDFSDYFTEPEKARAGYQEVFLKGFVRDYPLELKHLDGHTIPVLYKATLYRDEQGQTMGVFAAARDITKRKEAEEALKRSEEAYRLLVEFNPVGVFSHVYNPVTKENRRLHCNDAHLRILGYSSLNEYLISAPAESTVHKDVWNKYFETLLTDGNVINYPAQVRRKDGTVIWTLLNASARHHNGVLVVNGAMTDITAQKKTEERLLRAQKNLRAMASEIVMADERSRQYYSTELHDTVVQTMGAAKLRSQLIQDKIPQGVMPIFYEMQEFISQSITQARMIMAEMSPPVLYELGFTPALEWLTEQIGSHHNLSIQFQPRKIPTLIHEVQVLLFQSTRELLMNIVKHSQAKTVHIKILADGSKIRIEVKDDGTGFDARQAFRTDVSKGGFGLFSIRERLRHLGGELLIRSKPGRGTKVIMTVPRLPNGNS